MLISALELRIPPMAVAALTAVAMGGLAMLDSTTLSWTLVRIAVSSLIAVVGLMFVFSGPIAFVIYIVRFQILPEERVLSEKFGADYLAYREKVPRWL